MGNDNSKTTIENQQLIMQLQQQLYQQSLQNQKPQHPLQPQHPPQQHNTQHPKSHNQQYPQPNRTNPIPNKSDGLNKILSILANKELMMKIEQKPGAKRKLLEKLLNEYRHIMTSNQVLRISQALNSLPPEDNNDTTKYAFQNVYENRDNRDDRESLGFNQGTTPRDNTSRQLQTMQQLNTIDALTKHYKTEAEEEEAAFKIEEERRRKDFAERQRQRRLHYQASLTELEKSDIDSLRLFQLQKNYTIDELKVAYKKLAMKTHPDKTGGNAEQFQLVTKCYMSLLEKYKNRESDKSFNDLRSGSKSYIDEQNGVGSGGRSGDRSGSSGDRAGNGKTGSNSKLQAIEPGPTVQKDKFDNKLFNKIYEQNKLWESGDDGYGDWLTSNQDDEAPEVFGKKFNINVFNTTFEGHKDKLTAQSGAIQEFKEPQELVSSSTGFTDIDIFARKVNDFSKPLPIVGSGGSSKADLAYTDLKTAYTSRGAFIDPNKVEYKTYNSIDELKRDRSAVRYDMTPEQMRDYELRKRREIEEEEKRQDVIRQRDNIVANSYTKIHEKMLGYRGNASY